MNTASAPFNLMIKPVGPTCNLACSYCYYRQKSEFLPDAPAVMDDAALERVTQAYLEAHPDGDVVFNWQGGEPLLAGIEFYRRAVELQKRYVRPGQTVFNALQTNALLVDADWARFFAGCERFLVGVSLDGPAYLHDPYRITQSGEPSHPGVLRGLRILLDAGVPVNVLATVNHINVAHPLEVYRHIRQQGIQHIQFVPVVERKTGGSNRTARWSVSANQLGQFLCTIFDEWIESDIGEAYVQLFESSLAVCMGGWPSVCAQSPICGRGLVVERGGELFACDHYVYPDYQRGAISDAQSLVEMVDGDAQRAFGEAKADLSIDCLGCRWLRQCGGDCPKHRFAAGSDGKPISVLCEGYRAFFTHSDRAFQYVSDSLTRN